MIPTVILAALLASLLPKGWLVVLFAAISWPILLVATGVDSGLAFVFGASALAAVNALVGFLVGKALRILFTRIERWLFAS